MRWKPTLMDPVGGLLPLLTLFAIGCSSSDTVTSPDVFESCLAAVQVDGRLFIHAPDESLPPGFAPQKVVETVRRSVGCPDTPGSTVTGFREDGDALGFPVGAPVFAIEGFSPDERLTAEQGDGFVVLEVED